MWVVRRFPEIEALDDDAKAQVCQTMREDGAFIEAGENDNLIVQKLEANPEALGIFGFSFLDQNMDQLQGSVINGAEPAFENIADGHLSGVSLLVLLCQERARRHGARDRGVRR